MKQQTKSKALVILNIILLLALFTIPVYAYWASKIKGDTKTENNNSVAVGTGEEITISITPTELTTEKRRLVPKGFGEQTNADVYAGDTESFVVTYSVKWDDDEALEGIADANISASVSNILVDRLADSSDLIVVTPDVDNPTTIALKETVTFTFTVTMNEPANKTQYDAVAGKNITFDVTFEVYPNE